MSPKPPRSPRRRPRNENGQSSGEEVGIVIVAAMLVVSLLVPATSWGQDGADGVSRAICKIVSFGEGECSDAASTQPPPVVAAPPKDYRPPQCTARKTNEGYSSSINLGVVKIGEDQYFAATETKVRNADGSTSPKITVVVTDGASLAVEGGVGATGEFDNSGLGAELKASVGGNVKSGDSWEFSSQAEYDTFRKQWSDYEIQEKQLQGQGAAGISIYKWLTNSWVEPPRPADYSNAAVGVEVGATGSGGAYIFGKEGPDGTKEDDLSLNIDAYGKLKLSDTYLLTTDRRPGHEGETATTYTVAGDANAGANAVFVGGDIVDGTSQGAVKVDQKTMPDGSSRVTKVTLTTTAGTDIGLDPKATNGPVGSNKGTVGSDDKAQDVVVTTTTIDVTDANRSVVESWLSQGGGGNGRATDLAVPTTIWEPTSQGPSDDPFSQLLYEEAVVTKERLNTTDDNFNAGLTLALGMKVGADVGLTDEETRPTAASYLDAPGPDGIRKYVDNTDCIK